MNHSDYASFESLFVNWSYPALTLEIYFPMFPHQGRVISVACCALVSQVHYTVDPYEDWHNFLGHSPRHFATWAPWPNLNALHVSFKYQLSNIYIPCLIQAVINGLYPKGGHRLSCIALFKRSSDAVQCISPRERQDEFKYGVS